MCGIVGYIGNQQAVDVLLNGLSKLEYRGYDSAGIAVIKDNAIEVKKAQGKLQNLKDIISEDFKDQCHIGIGHTRWATHGKPSDVNAHPHTSAKGNFSLVHNGIIENYLQLKEEYLKDVTFLSETDTEVAVHLLEHFYTGDFEKAVRDTMNVMRGAFTLVILSKDEPNKIIACRKDSPLVLGIGEKENFLASDIPALLSYTRKCIYVENEDLCVITADDVKIYNKNNELVSREIKEIDWSVDAAEKGGYDHFMLKEIFEQPSAFVNTMRGRIVDYKITFQDIPFDTEAIRQLKKIHIVACGTAYHSGLVGRAVFEKIAKIPVEVEVASEFRYREPFLDEDTLVITISQSGETADTLAALRAAHQKGCKVLAITNVVGSSIAREADYVLYLWAGPEISVASTKAYTTMLLAQYLLSIYFANIRGFVDDAQMKTLVESLEKLPQYTEELLTEERIKAIEQLATEYKDVENCFFIGRGLDWYIAMEGSLKLKEISYIHAEAYAAGELKHGTLALITEQTPVFAINLQSSTYEKTLSNIKEVTARDAKVTAIVKKGDTETIKVVDSFVELPDADESILPILAVIPLQLMAYYIAKIRNCSIDQPRNLAKSVTVE